MLFPILYLLIGTFASLVAYDVIASPFDTYAFVLAIVSFLAFITSVLSSAFGGPRLANERAA